MKNKKGFTLIEVLVVSFLSSIVFLGVTTSVAQSTKILNDTVLHTMTTSNIQLYLYELSKDVKEGVAIDDCYYNTELRIHMKNGGLRTWKVEYSDNSYIPVRIDETGTRHEFPMMGVKENGQWKYFYPYFLVNRDISNPSALAIGKYHKVNVFIGYYDSYSGYNNWNTQASFSCKQEAKYYGF